MLVVLNKRQEREAVEAELLVGRDILLVQEKIKVNNRNLQESNNLGLQVEVIIRPEIQRNPEVVVELLKGVTQHLNM